MPWDAGALKWFPSWSIERNNSPCRRRDDATRRRGGTDHADRVTCARRSKRRHHLRRDGVVRPSGCASAVGILSGMSSFGTWVGRPARAWLAFCRAPSWYVCLQLGRPGCVARKGGACALVASVNDAATRETSSRGDQPCGGRIGRPSEQLTFHRRPRGLLKSRRGQKRSVALPNPRTVRQLLSWCRVVAFRRAIRRSSYGPATVRTGPGPMPCALSLSLRQHGGWRRLRRRLRRGSSLLAARPQVGNAPARSGDRCPFRWCAPQVLRRGSGDVGQRAPKPGRDVIGGTSGVRQGVPGISNRGSPVPSASPEACLLLRGPGSGRLRTRCQVPDPHR